MAYLFRSLQKSAQRVSQRTAGGWLAQRSAFSSTTLFEALGQSHSDAYFQSIRHPESFWGELARKRLRWTRPFVKTVDCDLSEGRIRWFEGGSLNVSGEADGRRW